MDKTGVLTSNNHSVEGLWAEGQPINASSLFEARRLQKAELFDGTTIGLPSLKAILSVMAVCARTHPSSRARGTSSPFSPLVSRRGQEELPYQSQQQDPSAYLRLRRASYGQYNHKKQRQNRLKILTENNHLAPPPSSNTGGGTVDRAEKEQRRRITEGGITATPTHEASPESKKTVSNVWENSLAKAGSLEHREGLGHPPMAVAFSEEMGKTPEKRMPVTASNLVDAALIGTVTID